MKKTVFISMALLLSGVFSAQADTNDRIILKNGKIVQGYISSQIPGQRITLMTDNDETPSYELKDVAIIEQAVRDSELVVGLVDVIQTPYGEFKGQIIKRNIGDDNKFIVIKTNVDEVDIAIKNIKLQKRQKLNPDRSLLSQAEFLDVVVTNSDKEYTGVITLQDFTSDPNGSFLCINQGDDEAGEGQKVYVKDIKELRRKLNKENYNPVRRFRVEQGNVYFNQNPVGSTKTTTVKKTINVIDDAIIMSAPQIQAPGGKLTIDTDDTQAHRKYFLLKLVQIPVGKQNLYAFTMEQAQKTKEIYDTIRQDGLGKTAQWTYILAEGYYALVDPESNTVYVVNIVK